MKIKLIAFFLFVFSIKSMSQDIELLSIFTNKSFRFTNIIDHDINSKWNYFGLTEMGVAYKIKNVVNFETDQFMDYKIANNLAIATGLGLQNNNILPQLGLAYAKEKQKWSYAFYPTVYYGLSDESWGSSMNSLIEYSPMINTKWDFYSLALLDFDYDFGEALGSQQYVNIGFQYKKKFLFGVNFDFEQEDNFKDNETEYGIFLGINL